MDATHIKTIVDIAQFLITGVIAIYIYLEKKRNTNTTRIESLEQATHEDVAAIKEKMAGMESRLSQAIGHNDLSPIYQRIGSVDKNVSEIKGKLHTLDLIHEFMIKGGNK